jgi:hypothetical protein
MSRAEEVWKSGAEAINSPKDGNGRMRGGEALHDAEGASVVGEDDGRAATLTVRFCQEQGAQSVVLHDRNRQA